MKKAMIYGTLAVVLLLIGGMRGAAQSVKRIEFAKGRSSATVRGNTGSYGVTYVVRARSGQKLVLTLTPAEKVGIKVERDGSDGRAVLLREERGGTFVVGLEESGDYTIFIGSTKNRPAAFNLTVKIARMTDI